uniref:Uncharacterized protein n=1 Tax=Aegilops tauschii subsp. strangulata TaxID=200361 RepID=A0A453CYY0_AEGTS
MAGGTHGARRRPRWRPRLAAILPQLVDFATSEGSHSHQQFILAMVHHHCCEPEEATTATHIVTTGAATQQEGQRATPLASGAATQQRGGRAACRLCCNAALRTEAESARRRCCNEAHGRRLYCVPLVMHWSFCGAAGVAMERRRGCKSFVGDIVGAASMLFFVLGVAVLPWPWLPWSSRAARRCCRSSRS